MAESVVTFFVQKLCEILEHEISDLVGVAEEVSLLRDKLMMLHAFLKDADCKCKESERVKIWVSQIRDVAFDAEDIIDKFIFECQQRHLRTSSGFVCSVTKCVGKINQLKALREVSEGIKKINMRLDCISATRTELGIDSLPDGGEARSTRGKRAPIVEELDVVGIEDEANIIANKLLEDGRRRSVVSIYGMGGLGKTTLARKVYNRTTISRNFQCMAWITVSQEYSVRQLLYDIIHRIKAIEEKEKKEMEKKSDEELSGIVHGYLTGKRYLVVIDDIWSIQAWNDLEKSLPDDMNGSRILLTTRKRDVASEADPTSKPHLLRFLTENECWDLFRKKAFPVDTDHICPMQLEGVGREVVGKCGGIPLAVVVLGGLLSKKAQTIKEWEKVLQSISWQLHESENQISRILSLSYHDLPHYLKSCFLHVCLFRKDTAIPARNLMWMWVAEGLVEKRGDETMEDVAEDYMLELIDRSMIQVAHNTFSRVKTYRIHDLLRELGIKVAEEDKFLGVYGNVDAEHASATAARRLAITHHDISKYIFLNRETRCLRSLYCFTKYSLEKKQWKSLPGRFKLLRVLHIDGANLSFLPDEIGHLINLRYLVIKSNGITLDRLPSTFSNLCNLQTLSIRGSNIIQIHDDIWKMKELRHLRLDFGILPQMAKHCQLDQLTNLQTLSMLWAGEWINNELGKLTGLRKLGVRGVLNSYKGLFNSISKLTNLEALWLEIQIGDLIPISISFSHSQSLERMFLQGHLEKLPAVQDFPPSLTKIKLWGSQLQQDPFAILGRLPNLQIIILFVESYLGEKMTCSSQSFPKLVHLKLSYVETLEEWTVEEGAMPNLRNLDIELCRKLKMIPEGLRHVTSLNALGVYSMPIDFVKRIEPEGKDWYKIQHVPSITIR